MKYIVDCSVTTSKSTDISIMTLCSHAVRDQQSGTRRASVKGSTKLKGPAAGGNGNVT